VEEEVERRTRMLCSSLDPTPGFGLTMANFPTASNRQAPWRGSRPPHRVSKSPEHEFRMVSHPLEVFTREK
jgi:hypothetical protein